MSEHSLQQLREQRTALASETRALMDAHPGDQWGRDSRKNTTAW